MNADMASAINRIARFTLRLRKTNDRKGETLFCFFEELFHSPAIYQVFQPCLLAIRAVAILAEDANHRGGHGHRLLRTQQQSAVGGELLVSGDSAEQYAEINSGRNDCGLRPRASRQMPMSLVSATTLIAPPLSKATLNFLGRPYMSREFRM